MNFKGLFGNNVATPQWKNKEGVNEFDKTLDRLAEIGKKITNLRKKADGLAAGESVVAMGEIPNPSGLGIPAGTAGIVSEVLGQDKVMVKFTGSNVGTPVAMNQVRKASVKLADGEAAVTETPETQSKEQEVSFAHYDAAPRSLSESFHARGAMGDRAIMKAREILGKQVEKMNLPAVDIYYLKSDISRFAGDGTPATGRISFQIPLTTPQGDQRTVYADVDIILGSLMTPKYFQDTMNQKFAFSEEGVGQLLSGRDFEMMTNPKVAPETTYFEAPGHLAGRGGMGITKLAEEPQKPVTEIMPGTDLANIISQLEATTKDIEIKKQKIKEFQETLAEIMKKSPESAGIAEYTREVSKLKKSEKDLLDQIASVLGAIQDKTVKYTEDLWKLDESIKASKVPAVQPILGELIRQLKATIPNIETIIDQIYEDEMLRTMTMTKSLVKETPGPIPQKKEWEIGKETSVPAGLYVPEKERERRGNQDSMMQKQSVGNIAKQFESVFAELGKIESAIEQAKSQLAGA